MGHYDSCYEADAQDDAKKRHKEIKKELKDLINKLDDDPKVHSQAAPYPFNMVKLIEK